MADGDSNPLSPEKPKSVGPVARVDNIAADDAAPGSFGEAEQQYESTVKPPAMTSQELNSLLAKLDGASDPQGNSSDQVNQESKGSHPGRVAELDFRSLYPSTNLGGSDHEGFDHSDFDEQDRREGFSQEGLGYDVDDRLTVIHDSVSDVESALASVDQTVTSTGTEVTALAEEFDAFKLASSEQLLLVQTQLASIADVLSEIRNRLEPPQDP